MEYQLSKEILTKYLEQGFSSRKIEGITGIKYWNVINYIKQYGLQDLNKYAKVADYKIDYFHKIDTKEKAYILGFLLGDGCLSKDDKFEIDVQLDDREIIDFMISEIGGHSNISNKLDKTKKQFPHIGFKIGENHIVRDIKMLFGGRLKEERHIPMIKPRLERYLVQGFFDAEGCITWGKRKDRDRIWQKISFTSQYHMLEGIQNILDKNDISSKIRPKANEKCYVIEMASKKQVLEFLHYIYPDNNFIILNRKYNKAEALRLELGEFGESFE
jgi:hypothetical protein